MSGWVEKEKVKKEVGRKLDGQRADEKEEERGLHPSMCMHTYSSHY